MFRLVQPRSAMPAGGAPNPCELEVPQVIVPESSNNLLSGPSHPDTVAVQIVRRRRFAFDGRLWLPL
jgi:hypothetical protein